MKILFLLLISFNGVLNASTEYIGEKTCVSCHKQEYKDWQDSHHDLAMQVPNDKTVLGNFNKASFLSKAGIKTTFFKRSNKFIINTDGPDGKLHDYEVAYVFGVYPLQQYMIKFPKGKVQVLDIAWDSRSKKEGGQRWYHLHPNEVITSKSVLHWTGPNMNWNYMCADCHSTNLKKNYDPQTKAFNTRYDVINVSCESCHGPASAHEKWATSGEKGDNGFDFHLEKSSYSHKTRLGDKTHKEVEMCAKCHSRRAPLDDEYIPGDDFNDHYRNVMLSEAHYFSDGKIKDEVYVYNSFKQSKMYEAGVTCSDCHNPHSLKRKAVGEQVCYQCHTPKKYTATTHTKHKMGTKDVSCITCHMPSRMYMGVDERNDHSFRLPRPDLSENSDIPNACNNCHKDKDATWARKNMEKWYGKVPVGKQNFSHALESLRSNDNNAQKFLYEVLMSDAPNIAKATAIGYLGNKPSKQAYTSILQMLHSTDIDIKLKAVEALEVYPPKYRLAKLFELLKDKNKLIRIEAARQLSFIPMGNLDMKSRSEISKGIQEYKEVLLFNADRAETQNELASLYVNLKEYDKAEAAYKEALRIQPMFIPSYINLAYFYQGQKQEGKAFKVLNQALNLNPSSADLFHSRGLWFIRDKQNQKARIDLEKAANLDKNNVRYQYIYAVSMAEVDVKAAIKILENSLRRHAPDIQTLSAIIYYCKEIKQEDKARFYEEQLNKLDKRNLGK